MKTGNCFFFGVIFDNKEKVRNKIKALKLVNGILTLKDKLVIFIFSRSFDFWHQNFDFRVWNYFFYLLVLIFFTDGRIDSSVRPPSPKHQQFLDRNGSGQRSGFF